MLVLSPVNTLLNWNDEWNRWIPFASRDYRASASEKEREKRRRHFRAYLIRSLFIKTIFNVHLSSETWCNDDVIWCNNDVMV